MGTSELADEDLRRLMSRAQAGDRDAYATLLTVVSSYVRRLIRRQRGFLAGEAVEDLVQETLLSVHQARATYDGARPFLPWLRAIVAHRLADAARRYARRDAHEISLEDDEVTLDTLPAKREAESVGDLEALARAIRSLPAGQRQAIELMKLQELSLKDASAATGLSVSALKVATHRAMTALKRALRLAESHED